MEIKLEVDLNITVIDKSNNRARMLTNDTKVTGERISIWLCYVVTS